MNRKELEEANRQLLKACKYVVALTGAALTKEQAATLGKRCQAAIDFANGDKSNAQ